MAQSAFINNNANLKIYPTFINTNSLCNNVAPLIISNISKSNVCIPRDITIDTSKVSSTDSYSNNRTTLAVGENDITADTQTNNMQQTHTVNMHIKENTSGQSKTVTKDAKLPNLLVTQT